jgi:hypothetical protein
MASHTKGRCLENRVLRRIFGPKREEVAVRDWRRLHNEELLNLHTLPNMVTMIKTKRMR